MAALVLDASVTIAGLAPDENDAACVALLERVGLVGATAPPLWLLEVANILVLKARRELISPASYQRLMGLVHDLPIDFDLDHLREHSQAAGQLALTHKLTVYDAAYLELALRLHLPLATLDKSLAKVCAQLGVPVLP